MSEVAPTIGSSLSFNGTLSTPIVPHDAFRTACGTGARTLVLKTLATEFGHNSSTRGHEAQQLQVRCAREPLLFLLSDSSTFDKHGNKIPKCFLNRVDNVAADS